MKIKGIVFIVCASLFVFYGCFDIPKPNVTVDNVDVFLDLASLSEACQELQGPCAEQGLTGEQCGWFIYQMWVSRAEEAAQAAALAQAQGTQE